MLRLRIYDWYEKTRFLRFGPWQREQGKRLAQLGLRLQAPFQNDDRRTVF